MRCTLHPVSEMNTKQLVFPVLAIPFFALDNKFITFVNDFFESRAKASDKFSNATKAK